MDTIYQLQNGDIYHVLNKQLLLFLIQCVITDRRIVCFFRLSKKTVSLKGSIAISYTYTDTSIT